MSCQNANANNIHESQMDCVDLNAGNSTTREQTKHIGSNCSAKGQWVREPQNITLNTNSQMENLGGVIRVNFKAHKERIIMKTSLMEIESTFRSLDYLIKIFLKTKALYKTTKVLKKGQREQGVGTLPWLWLMLVSSLPQHMVPLKITKSHQ